MKVQKDLYHYYCQMWVISGSSRLSFGVCFILEKLLLIVKDLYLLLSYLLEMELSVMRLLEAVKHYYFIIIRKKHFERMVIVIWTLLIAEYFKMVILAKQELLPFDHHLQGLH